MSTYLEICQKVAQRSGTVPSLGEPASVTGATGRLQRIIDWVNEAWEDIQSASEDWLWMSAEFSGQTVAGTASYDASAMGITSRFRNWEHIGEEGEDLFTIYKTSDGAAEEGKLCFREWDYMRREAFIADWDTNSELRDKPAYITIDPALNLVLYPVPDAAYTVRGRYVKSLQTLSANADTPELPATFHDVITYKALLLLAIFDEDDRGIARFERLYQNRLDDLSRHQLPKLRFGGPLA